MLTLLFKEWPKFDRFQLLFGKWWNVDGMFLTIDLITSDPIGSAKTDTPPCC